MHEGVYRPPDTIGCGHDGKRDLVDLLAAHEPSNDRWEGPWNAAMLHAAWHEQQAALSAITDEPQRELAYRAAVERMNTMWRRQESA